MAFSPVVHGIYPSIRFGRVLFVEVAEGPPPGRPCRYCDLLDPHASLPRRVRFSDPERLSHAILDEVVRGAAVDAVVLGGPGDPLCHVGIGPLLRRIRTAAHLATIVLTDGLLLGDRTVRRDSGEADTVVVVLPAVETSGPSGADLSRRDAYARHVKGIAALGRETRVKVCVEILVRPGENDGDASLEAWRRGVATIGPDRVFVLPADVSPAAERTDVVENLERIGREIAPGVGVCLIDPTPIDRRCYCADRADD